MKEKIRDMENEINSLRIDMRKMNEKMDALLDVISDMRRKYASQLGISDNEFMDLERVR
jgi:chaperonin cofactor prefoldin